MALFFDGLPCPLCGVKMTSNDRRFATTHFLGPESDLHRFSDAVMHWDCYAKWDHRTRFGRMYFKCHRKWHELGFPPNSIVYSDDQIHVSTYPKKHPRTVDVMLAETGSGFSIAIDDWEGWLSGKCFEDCQHPIERDALVAVLPQLRTRLPTAKAVVVATRRTEKRDTMKLPLSRDEFACVYLAVRAAMEGLACPGCGHISTEYDFVRVEQVSEVGPQSHLVCRDCGREFGPADV